ncbi:hypothetical protein [Desulfosediminicola flagellatus]|uniref:hypothetical protein n=1 Tax=Desulfosediminicola flagellatus TaxID=2569541 RepID=UPI0010AB6807|nr:hypothetical protein [Desulfosediminicola flagellatus]
MNTRIVFLIQAVTIVFLLAGCTTHPTPVEQFYGTSFKLAMESQIANPGAGMESGPPEGLEGEVAVMVVERHLEGFDKKAAKTETYTLNIEGSK